MQVKLIFWEKLSISAYEQSINKYKREKTMHKNGAFFSKNMIISEQFVQGFRFGDNETTLKCVSRHLIRFLCVTARMMAMSEKARCNRDTKFSLSFDHWYILSPCSSEPSARTEEYLEHALGHDNSIPCLNPTRPFIAAQQNCSVQ